MVDLQAKNASLLNFGARLRGCRKALGYTQAEFAALGGIVTNSQSRYESNTTEPSASYFEELAKNGVDVLWILTGRRGGSLLTPEQTTFLEAVSRLRPIDRAILLQLAASLAGQPTVPNLVALPSSRALTVALQTYLEHSPGLDGAELAHDLATQLPTILQGAEDELPGPATDLADVAIEPPAADDGAKWLGPPKRSS